MFGLSVEGLFLHGFDSEQVCFCVGLFCPIFLLISPPFLYNIFGLGAVCWPIFSFIMAINREEMFYSSLKKSCPEIIFAKQFLKFLLLIIVMAHFPLNII